MGWDQMEIEPEVAPVNIKQGADMDVTALNVSGAINTFGRLKVIEPTAPDAEI